MSLKVNARHEDDGRTKPDKKVVLWQGKRVMPL